MSKTSGQSSSGLEQGLKRAEAEELEGKEPPLAARGEQLYKNTYSVNWRKISKRRYR